ncbi:MAG: queuine tRNA-ribosyltransferase family protein [Chloroflexi bacterium]|nr:queuine tRNA-ribosyltransferase family protein [Chloroflexota bacterium]
MRKTLDLPHGRLQLPTFLPDGTQGVVRSVDAQDLAACGIQAVQMNVFHLMQRPGSSTIQALGGLHQMAGWERPLFTDSGGFQVYSLIRQNPKSGSISDKGAIFHVENHKYNLTPEKSVQLQLSYGSDVVICLDDCTHVDDPADVQAESVRRTVAWARRCKEEFARHVGQKKYDGAARPKLVAVVQGGGSPALRRQCAEQLLEIGFDGYGYGGWPLDAEGRLLRDMLATVRELIPPEYTVHALGVGHPDNVAACVQMGYELFDSTMPTRDARHGRLYAFTQDPTRPLTAPFFRYFYIKDDKHIKTNRPISPFCDCPVCARYSLGYLHHLFKLNDSLYPRLATMHNLRFMTQLMAGLGDKVVEDAGSLARQE